MKNVVKLALVGAALFGGVAQADPISYLPGTGGVFPANGSSLVLFAKDTVNSADGYFFVDLGVQIGSLISLDSVSGSTSGVTTFNVSGISSSAISSFQSWLGGAGRSSSIKWSILASERNATNTSLAGQSAAFTSLNDYSSSSAPTNANVGTFASGLQGFFNYLNTNADTADGLSSSAGWDGSAASGGNNADQGFGAFPTGANLGQAMKFWDFAMNSNSGSATANKYLGATLTLTAAGLEIVNPATSEVPVPAAVWLFGSGLLGLMGVGRRKAIAAA